jgi:nucleoside 2-deoxyribosyltransferase
MRDFLNKILLIGADVYGEHLFESNKILVYPTDEHLEDSKPCIQIHHEGIGDETDKSIELRNNLMNLYFKAIDDCDLVFIYNLKDGKEHIGAGALMELGYAHAKNKKIYFLLKPTEANVLSMFAGNPEYLLEML